MIRTIALLLVVACVAMAATATTPITATVTTTTSEVIANGQTNLINQIIGTFARASDGRELRVTLDPKTNQPATAILRTADNEDVVMKYANRKYTVNHGGPQAPHEVQFFPKAGAESQTINGVYVVAIPNYDGNNPGKLLGKAWYSPQYKITVRSEMDMTMNGKTIRRVTEMTNIKIGTEPDLSQFVVPGDFAVVSGSPCSVCSH